MARPADVLIPPVDGDSRFRSPRGMDRSLDVVVSDPRSAPSILHGSDSFRLVAARDSDKLKHSAFNALIRAVGPGVIPISKVSLSFESSGAFGPAMGDLWKEFKNRHAALETQNYIRAGIPHTCTAFTFAQYWPQRISFAINKFTAQMMMLGLRKSRRSAVPS